MKLSDMLFANALMSGGDSGSSDFSTAEVTIVLTSEELEISVFAPIVSDDEVFAGSLPSVTLYGDDPKPDPELVALYKGQAVLLLGGDARTVTTTGNITEILANTQYLITGDCTLTISAS